MQIEVPGGSAVILDADTITNKQRNALVGAFGGVDKDNLQQNLEAARRFVAALVVSWSFDAPVNFEGTDEIPAKAHDALLKAGLELLSQLQPDFGPDLDPKATTAA